MVRNVAPDAIQRAGVPALLEFSDLAAYWGVPVNALRKIAVDNGLAVRIGKRVKIADYRAEELLQLCQEPRKAPDFGRSVAKVVPQSGSFETTAASKSRPGLRAAEKLKRRSNATSLESTGRVVPLTRQS